MRVKSRRGKGSGHLALPILSDHRGQDAESLRCQTPVLYTCSPSCKQNHIHYTPHCSAAAQDSSHEHCLRRSRSVCPARVKSQQTHNQKQIHNQHTYTHNQNTNSQLKQTHPHYQSIHSIKNKLKLTYTQITTKTHAHSQNTNAKSTHKIPIKTHN